jgi:carboxyl-terminal processing protease
MNAGRKGFVSVITLFLMAALALGAAFFLWQMAADPRPSDKIPVEAASDFGLMAEAWNAIQAHYVDRPAVKPTAMTYGAISGMVDALGDIDHSTFLSPEEIQHQEEFTKGRYKGIGVEIKIKNGHVTIVTPLDDSPAQKAGIQAGEVILAVDGRNVAGLNLLQVVKMVSGPVGTDVKLLILDPQSGLTREVTVARAEVSAENVTWIRLPGSRIDHLRIAAFSETVTQSLIHALEVIGRDAPQGIVLDLRNNPGGVLASAVSAASQFLPNGNVLLEKDAQGRITGIPVEQGGLALHIPMVCLVNGGTASAAEIVAGALKDHQRARLVGTQTFGTGTVLQEFPLSDGSALLLAVKEWLTPDGKTIWHKGILPDREVPLAAGASPLTPLEVRGMTAQDLQQSKDRQLLEAMGLLTGKAESSSGDITGGRAAIRPFPSEDPEVFDGARHQTRDETCLLTH